MYRLPSYENRRNVMNMAREHGVKILTEEFTLAGLSFSVYDKFVFVLLKFLRFNNKGILKAHFFHA